MDMKITSVIEIFVWHGKHLFSKHLLFSSSCELSSSALKLQTPKLFSLAQVSVWASVACLWGLMSLRLPYIQNLFFSCVVRLVSIWLLDLPKELEEKKGSFPPLWSLLKVKNKTNLRILNNYRDWHIMGQRFSKSGAWFCSISVTRNLLQMVVRTTIVRAQ